MNTRLSANLSVLGTSLMLILSFSFGFHSYTEAKKTIVTDLNQALQQTILQNSHLWMSQDSIRTYANLSKLFGNPVSIESYNKDFSDALSYTPDKKKTGIVIHLLTMETYSIKILKPKTLPLIPTRNSTNIISPAIRLSGHHP